MIITNRMKSNMIKWNNLQELLKKRGERAKLSKVTGISTGNITDWFNPNKNAQPSADALVKIAEYFNCSVDYLLDRINDKDQNNKSPIIYLLPVYEQSVAAGPGQLGFDQIHKMEKFHENDIPKKVSYGIHIDGNSMETDDENNIPDKSIVLVSTEFDYDVLMGEAVIANIGGVLVCKEYNIAEDGHLWLKSRNPDKSNEDRHIYDIDRVKIIGRVVNVISA